MKLRVGADAEILLSEKDAQALNGINQRMLEQSLASQIQSHLCDGPFFAGRESETRVWVKVMPEEVRVPDLDAVTA